MAPRPPPAPRLFSRLSHASNRSHSSSFEADDERSSIGSADIPSRMSPDRSSSGGRSRSSATSGRRINPNGNGNGAFAHEDTRPTSSKELAGFYAYSFAAEVYVVCAIGSFIPILLESLARENGVLLSDRTSPCGASSDKDSDDDGQCIVHILGMEINTASFAMYTFSISVLLQALLVVSISSAADHGNFRKKLLLAFAWIGSMSVMCYIFVTKNIYILGALLAIVSNTSFGASFVLLNSFLPLLVRRHPSVVTPVDSRTPDLTASDGESQPLEPSARIDTDGEEEFDPRAALLPGHPEEGRAISRVRTNEEKISEEMSLSTQISARGIGIGYIAALFLQCVAIFILVRMKNTTWSQRVVLCVIGAWWAIFTIPAALWLRPRPGPPLPSLSHQTGVRAWISYTVYAWKSLFRTVKLATRLVDIMLFLGGWFLLSDAIATTSSTAILFAKTQLHMEPWALGMINVISTASGIVGAFSWAFISRRFKLQAHQTILACIALFELIPLYGLMGYLPFVKNWGVFGLQQPWEMYPLAAIYGFVLGGLSSYCRSLYGELIPPGSEAAFYALYAITDKGSSVFGPAIVGAIIDSTGHIRPAFWFLAALVGLPAPLIWFINVDRGKREGETLAEVIEGFKQLQQSGGEEDVSSERNSTSEGDSQGILARYDDD
ncbi:autophagy-related protein 22-like protein [Immersiella caudata]|uniref:Autophagy-related protein n=1 Tax=Immersiella caudata TaxID=314043 RepID=A0AA40CC19_9PEZI|nr:autophagy-related protein 22-like protein [Immersiella caudata]